LALTTKDLKLLPAGRIDELEAWLELVDDACCTCAGRAASVCDLGLDAWLELADDGCRAHARRALAPLRPTCGLLWISGENTASTECTVLSTELTVPSSGEKELLNSGSRYSWKKLVDTFTESHFGHIQEAVEFRRSYDCDVMPRHDLWYQTSQWSQDTAGTQPTAMLQ